MAKLFPAPHTKHVLAKMTGGERRFAARLMAKLEDDYLCWYDVPVGRKQLHPDYIVLHPLRGLLILEVKDWKCETIQQADKTSVTLLTERGLVHKPSPLEQARSHAHAVMDLLEKDPFLTSHEGAHQGKPLFAWGYGTVLTNITRAQFEQMQLDQAWPADKVLCQDEMTETVDAEAFQSRLWGMFNRSVTRMLTLAQMDRIRWHLYPEIRIEPQTQDLFEAPSNTGVANAIPEIVRIMDLQQEQLARNLGDGHRIIHGVAGSGKTLLLVYRCLQLSERLQGKPILVLCFNKTLAARLRHILQLKGAGDSVQIDNFHGWVYRQLQAYNIDLAQGQNFEASCAANVSNLIKAIESERVPRSQYAAVLIDEGHDFEEDWFRLLVQMIDPSTNSLLLLYDDAQSIYQKNRKFSWSSVGIQAQGRTSILKVNYRNTEQILRFAYQFVTEFLQHAQLSTEQEDIPFVEPNSIGRQGITPELIEVDKPEQEFSALVAWIKKRHQAGVPYGEIAVLYRTKWQAERLQRCLQENALPYNWLTESSKSRKTSVSLNYIQLLTLHSSKGLEFNSVAIPHVSELPHPKAELAQEARLLYVGMTRAMEALMVSGVKGKGFMEKLALTQTEKSL